MKMWKYSMLFCFGGSCYYILELLFRGRSHGSMFLAGGICFLLIGHLGAVEPKLAPGPRAVVGAAVVTMVELGVGMAVNRTYEVWDYRALPGNFMGQICPLFSLLWIPVSLAAILLYGFLEKRIVIASRCAHWRGNLRN